MYHMFNYILTDSVYPNQWAERLIRPVFKSGNKTDANNYRRITLLPSVAKILYTMINNLLVFFTDSWGNGDIHNGGFKKGSYTADNLVILNSMIQRQKALNRPLFIAFIDFRKAFDSINHSLFYELLKPVYHGKIINLLKSLYSKTKGKIKVRNMLLDFLHDTQGVNQGGVSSPFLVRVFLIDLHEYLNKTCGIWLDSEDELLNISSGLMISFSLQKLLKNYKYW